MQNSATITDTVIINVLDREFKIKCPPDKVIELKKAASHLDNKMREIHHNNKLITIDRIAITAALNIAHELILQKQQAQLNTGNLSNRLHNLKTKLHQASVISK